MKKVTPAPRARKQRELQKVVESARARKHPQAEQARQFLEKHGHELPPEQLKGGVLDPETAHVRKRERDREREPFRSDKRRRVREQSARTRRIPARSDDLWAMKALTEHSGDKYYATIEPKHRAMIVGLADLLNRAREPLPAAPANAFRSDEERREHEQFREQLRREHPNQATSGALDQLERAYVAAFQWPVDRAWQWCLHHHAEYALAKRLKPPAERRGWPGIDSGELLARRVFFQYHPFVPSGLRSAGPKLERILNTATLGAGGGRKKSKNVRAAIDELIRELGEEPFQPALPPTLKQTRK